MNVFRICLNVFFYFRSVETLVINDIVSNSHGQLILSWQYQTSSLPNYYQIEIYDEHEQELLDQRLIDGHQQSIIIEKTLPSNCIVCIHCEEKKFCRNISLPSNSIQSASFLLSSANKHSHADEDDNEQYLYLIGGILLGATLVCTILILICCYCRLRSNMKEQVKPSLIYQPLNMISYPSQQTSECSLHSSTDTSHLSNDPYHIYQQIPSIHNCQIYSTRTHVRV